MLNNDLATQFLSITTLEELCNILNISINQLKYLLFVKKKTYVQFQVPKRNGEYRTISAPTNDLKIIQRRLSSILYEIYDFPAVQHGFVKGHNCVTNARNHVQKRFVLNMDLENYFDTIHFGRVRGMFLHSPFNFNNNIATILAKIVCYHKCLPQGAPTSPVISNILCYSMDRELNHLTIKNKCQYTRYADDITFSTNSEKFPEEIAKINDNEIVISDKIVKAISGSYITGFKINPSKTKLSKRYHRQEVTGIIVNEKLNTNKIYIRNIRALLHNIEKKGFLITAREHYFHTIIKNEHQAKNKLFNELQGKLNFLKMVKGYNDKSFLKYAKQFNEIFNTLLFDVDAISRLEEYAAERCYVLQSIDELSQGTGFFIKDKGIYTSTHIFINKTTCKNFCYNTDQPYYKNQFPFVLGDDKLQFFSIMNNLDKKIANYIIHQENYESDILTINNTPFSKSFDMAKNSPQISDKIYMIGYPGFLNYSQSSICIIETKIIGISTLFGRTFFRTLDSPKHGMSGGPVLNEQREVIGIVYAGADLENDYQSDNVGFINLVGE